MAGLAVSITGFAVTIYNVLKTASAAEVARRAAESVKRDLARVDSIALATEILRAMGEIKTLHRRKVWELLPDRYSAIRLHLVDLKLNSHGLDNGQKRLLQSSIQAYSEMEAHLDTVLGEGKNPDVTKFTETINKQEMRIQELIVFYKRANGEDNG